MMVAISILLIATLSVVGLLAVWAASSSKSWFLRASLFVLVLATSLLIPAYEPFVAFVIQGVVVAIGVSLYRWIGNRATVESDPPRSTRFSIATLLQTTIFIAIAAAVALNLPALNWMAWSSVVLIGFVSGVATLMGLWAVFGHRPEWGLRVIVALTLSWCASIILVLGDWLLFSLYETYAFWPPLEDDPMGVIQGNDHLSLLWMPIILSVAGIVCFAVFLAAIANQRLPRLGTPRCRLAARCGVGLLFGVLVITPAGFCFQLLMRRAIPVAIPLDSNGWDDFVAAGRMLESSPELTVIDAFETATEKQLTSAVQAIAPIFQRLETGLRKPTRCPVDYCDDELDVDAIMRFGSLGRALASRGHLAELEGRVDDAAGFYLAGVRFGHQSRRGGLMIDGWVGIGSSRIGLRHLYHCREKFSVSRCSRLIADLSQLENQAEPAGNFIARDLVWSDNAVPWVGRAQAVLEGMAGVASDSNYRSFEKSCAHELADMRLLRIELAIQAWRLSRDRLPERLDELVPEFLPEVPVDPFNAGGGLLQYRLTDDGYLLYSVSYNGIDEGGKAPKDMESLWTSGDLRLDISYAPENW